MKTGNNLTPFFNPFYPYAEKILKGKLNFSNENSKNAQSLNNEYPARDSRVQTTRTKIKLWKITRRYLRRNASKFNHMIGLDFFKP